MLEGGVCGTDREICAFEYGTPPAGSGYLVIGHESLGEVVEVGSEVTRVQVGDLVVPMVRRPCPHDDCLACRAGRQDFCYTGDFTERGINERHGFMTELVVDDEQYMSVVPPALRDVTILVEPLTIAEKALTQIWQVQQRLPWACPIEPGKARGNCHRDLGVFMQRWPAAVRSLITGHYPMAAHHDLLLQAPTGIKNVIDLRS